MYIWAVFHGIYQAKSCTQKLMSIAMCHFKGRFFTKNGILGKSRGFRVVGGDETQVNNCFPHGKQAPWKTAFPIGGGPLRGEAACPTGAHNGNLEPRWAAQGAQNVVYLGAGIRRALDELRSACDRHQRDPEDVAIIPFGTLPDEGKLAYYSDLGISEAVLRLPSAGRDQVLHVLDDFTRFLG